MRSSVDDILPSLGGDARDGWIVWQGDVLGKTVYNTARNITESSCRPWRHPETMNNGLGTDFKKWSGNGLGTELILSPRSFIRRRQLCDSKKNGGG
jgi:hypothetical protein